MPKGGMEHCCICTGKRELGDERPCVAGCQGMICSEHMERWPWSGVTASHDPTTALIDETRCVICGVSMPPTFRKAGRPRKTCSAMCRRKRAAQATAASKRKRKAMGL